MLKIMQPVKANLSGELYDSLMAALAHNEVNYHAAGDISTIAGALRKKIERYGSHGVDENGGRAVSLNFFIGEGGAIVEQLAAYSYSMLNLLKHHNDVMKSTIALVNECNSSLPALLSGTETQYNGKAGDGYA